MSNKPVIQLPLATSTLQKANGAEDYLFCTVRLFAAMNELRFFDYCCWLPG
ncbi:hypothetical protein [Terriglobus sp. TAA 43]|uniref:hypothetical protein n=1 Tax=Terriglobus sp. TAA 43 TaxID=278961 RepID=UPI0012ECC4C2|nr:hypothetical protein [Terriglobus sp. TAA 43]